MARTRDLAAQAARPMAAKTERVSAKHIKPEAHNIGQMVDRIRTDPQFVFAMRVLKTTAKTVQVSIDGELPESREVIRESLMTTWTRSIGAMLEALEYGRQAFEVVYAFDIGSLSYVPHQLIPLEYELSKMVLSGGQFNGIKYGTKDPVILKPDESWWCAIDATPTKPYGKSLYLGAPWRLFKDREEQAKRDDMWFRRFSIGRSVTKAPPTDDSTKSQKGRYSEVNTSGEKRDPMADTAKILEMTEAGGDIILPSGNNTDGSTRYEHTPGADLKDATAIENRNRALDAAVLRVFGIPERALTQDGASGSRAVADTHQETFHDTVEGYVSQLVESYQENIVKRTLRVNHLPEDSLVVNYKSIGDATEARNEALILAIVQSGQVSPLITSGLIDVAQLVESVGLPIKDREGFLAKLAAPAASPFQMGMSEAFAVRNRVIRELSNVAR